MKTRSLAFLFIAALVMLPRVVLGADLLFSPASGSYAVGKDFAVKVLVDPASANINATDGTVAFDKDLLSVVSVSKEGSVFSLWTAEPSFSNSAGTVSFSGGTPTAFAKSGTVVTITFKAKAVGSAKASFSNGSVLAADGKGTNVYSKGGEATFTITEAAAEPPPAPKPAAPKPVAAAPISDDADGVKPLAPVINSTTHDKSDKWYATSTAIFTWKLFPDVIAVRTSLSEADNATPDKVQDGATTTQTLRDIKDGEWYFSVQFKNDFGWGEVAKKKISIDTVLPKEFEVSLLESADGSPPRLAFETEDELSGIDRYEIRFGEATVATVRAQDLVSGAFPVPPQEGGPQKVTIRAYDKAGNVREATKDLTLPAVAKPNPKGTEEVVAAPLWTIERMLTILFALVIGALATWNVMVRKRVSRENVILLERVAEIREKNDKVFSAMREEFEQIVNDFDERPQLTPAERDMLEKIKEVLEISEEIIDSGVEELKKVIKGK